MINEKSTSEVGIVGNGPVCVGAMSSVSVITKKARIVVGTSFVPKIGDISTMPEMRVSTRLSSST